MPTIKFHYPEHFTASRIRPNSNRKERKEREGQRVHSEEEMDGKRKGFTMVDGFL